MKATSFRRQLIVAVLLAFAVLGGAMRWLAPDPSIARDVGTLLLVLWLPAVGSIVGFVIARVRPSRAAPPFGAGAAFTPHLLVELTPMAAMAPPAGEHVCTLVVGNEGFTARLPVPVAQWLAAGEPRTMRVELRRPALALARLAVDTRFTVLIGRSVAGTGRVLQPDS